MARAAEQIFSVRRHLQNRGRVAVTAAQSALLLAAFYGENADGTGALRR